MIEKVVEGKESAAEKVKSAAEKVQLDESQVFIKIPHQQDMYCCVRIHCQVNVGLAFYTILGAAIFIFLGFLIYTFMVASPEEAPPRRRLFTKDTSEEDSEEEDSEED